jgi:hypothetical protein
MKNSAGNVIHLLQLLHLRISCKYVWKRILTTIRAGIKKKKVMSYVLISIFHDAILIFMLYYFLFRATHPACWLEYALIHTRFKADYCDSLINVHPRVHMERFSAFNAHTLLFAEGEKNDEFPQRVTFAESLCVSGSGQLALCEKHKKNYARKISASL